MRRPWWRPLPTNSEINWNLQYTNHSSDSWIPYVKRELFDDLKRFGKDKTTINHFEFATRELTSKNVK